ncbi:hypothetical protein HanRHA438_Chr09g0401651 [Helianthus annuus]|nr:hypothetical protein HanRHA438_Chr09g0401651 [Helianthus annuus]
MSDMKPSMGLHGITFKIICFKCNKLFFSPFFLYNLTLNTKIQSKKHILFQYDTTISCSIRIIIIILSKSQFHSRLFFFFFFLTGNLNY